jgi:hypothetical protein
MTAPVFNGIDHIMVRVDKAEPLIALFSDIFLLPVSWPLQRKEFATYAWITLGNTNLEFWAAADNADLPADQTLPLFSGFALDPPNLAASIALLQERGIACKPPRAFFTQNQQGDQVKNFTNSVILDVSNPACCVFFCQWDENGTIYPWPDKLTCKGRQLREQYQLEQCGGGALGVTGLLEMRMVTPDLQTTRNKWQAITGQTSDPFDLGRGIALTLCTGASVRIASIVLAVESLAVARAYLVSHRILGDEQVGEVSIAREACSQLDIRLKEVTRNE